jgi:hypothetical protein
VVQSLLGGTRRTWRQELMASKVKIPQDETITIEAKR